MTITVAECPTATKRSYCDFETACAAALRVSRRSGLAFRPYTCQCGSWHLTTKRKKDWR